MAKNDPKDKPAMKFSKAELKAMLAEVEANEMEDAKKNSDGVKKEVLGLLNSIADKVAIYIEGDLKSSNLFSWNEPVFAQVLGKLKFPIIRKPKVLVAVSDTDKQKVIALIKEGKTTLEAIAGGFNDTSKPYSKTRNKLVALEAANIIKASKERPKNYSVIA